MSKLYKGRLRYLMRPLWLAAMLAYLVAPEWALAGQPAQLKRVNILGRSGHTHITLSLSQAVHYHFFELSNPPRLVVDLPHTRGLHPHIAHGGSNEVKTVRMAEHKDGRLRVVFDLLKKAKVTMQPSSGRGAKLIASLPTLGPSVHSVQHPGRTGAARAVKFQTVPKSGPVIVVVDPGHGGNDPGTSGPHGLKEKTVTLGIARILAHELNATPGIRAYLTRKSDTYVSLTKRVLIAQSHKANLFVSIHENAYPKDPAVKGGTCYALSDHGASDAEASQLAREENSHDRAIAGVDFSHYSRSLNTVLTDLFQTAAMNAETHLGSDIIRQFAKVEPIYDQSVQRANFAVLRDPMIPSVLCETAFLSNPHQARELRHRHFRARLATAIYHGILDYLHHYSTMRIAKGASKGYVVKQGDTLSGIAAQFNVAAQRIKKANDLHGSLLRVGEHLTIPPAQQSS